VEGPKGVKGLSVINVGHGRWQVAFHNVALYRFVGDKKKGQAHGQGLANVWFAALKSGIPAGNAAPATSTQPSSASTPAPAVTPPTPAPTPSTTPVTSPPTPAPTHVTSPPVTAPPVTAPPVTAPPTTTTTAPPPMSGGVGF
jgi:hypothetical protein